MPAPETPNPSFCVLTLDDPARRDSVSEKIAETLPGEEGQVLTPLGGKRFALSRPVMKRLLVGRDKPGVEQLLGGIDGVAGVASERADKIAKEYLERTAGGPEAPPPAAARRTTRQWNLRMVKAAQAWRLFPGGSAVPWQGVQVGHIDTGYTEHPALGFAGGPTSSFVQPHKGINYKEGGELPKDPLGYNGQPGHGTRTMSVLAANLRDRFLGVAPGVGVVPYRLTNSVVIDAFGNDTELDKAIRHAVFDAGCDVISMSLGDPCAPPRRVGRQVDAAYEEGVIVVAAAGNLTSEVTYPGRYHRTVAAGGVTRRGRPWSGGSRGRRVTLCAPAADIYRANTRIDGGSPTYGYGGGGDGTSYATVHISGAAALWIAYHGARLNPYGRTWRRVEAFRTVLENSANRPQDWDSSLFGAGILDIEALLNAPLPDPGSLLKSEIPAARERV